MKVAVATGTRQDFKNFFSAFAKDDFFLFIFQVLHARDLCQRWEFVVGYQCIGEEFALVRHAPDDRVPHIPGNKVVSVERARLLCGVS
jgi:hypothetical protein